jgi:hypothetical protein
MEPYKEEPELIRYGSNSLSMSLQLEVTVLAIVAVKLYPKLTKLLPPYPWNQSVQQQM